MPKKVKPPKGAGRPPKGAIPTVLHGNRRMQQQALGTWGTLGDVVKFVQKRLK
jgi:hypothetical protein